MTEHLALPASAGPVDHSAGGEPDAGGRVRLPRRRHTGGTHRRRRSTTAGIAASALIAACTLTAAATFLGGSANAAPAPRPDDLQLGGWAKSCTAGHLATGIDYYTNRGEHGRADVGTGPAGTRYAIFLHRDGRGGESVTLTVHCAGRPPATHTTAFHVAGPGNNTEFEQPV